VVGTSPADISEFDDSKFDDIVIPSAIDLTPIH
jgi:hypothetical protein